MDGSNPVQLITGLDNPSGLAIDLSSQRLFWGNCGANTIQSSHLNGTDVQRVLGFNSDTYTCIRGIAIHGDKLFWGTSAWFDPQPSSYSFQTSNKFGQDLRMLCNGTSEIRRLTVAAPNPVQTRRNHCKELVGCTRGICVLNKKSFSCIP